jgi:integrase
MTQISLIEPSFHDMAVALEAANDLSPSLRSHLLCSVRQIGKALDRPLALIPARWTSVRHPVERLHHARVGVRSSPKTLANHKANLRAALRWFAKEEDVPSRGARLNAEWHGLRERLADRRARATLSGLMRFCSAKGVPPGLVDESVVNDFMRYRAETTAMAVDTAARRELARVWNACIGSVPNWPSQRLEEPPIASSGGPSWEAFPEGLRLDIDRHLGGMTKFHRSGNGRRRKASKPSTLRTRRAELVAVCRMAVRIGIPIESLTSLKVLAEPALANRILEAYWQKDGEEPKVFTIDLSSRFLAMARESGLDEAALTQLDDMRATLEEYRRPGLTPKNLKLVRQVLTDGIWSEVLNLPSNLMSQAHGLKDYAPIKAAVTAQLAVALAILTVAPVRLGNLTRIRLEENLVRPGGLGSPYWLVFPHYDVKNQVDLNFKLDKYLTELIDEYVHHFRPILLRGANQPWLFPGESGGFKGLATLSDQISQRVYKLTGLEITPHQFRHAAAAFYLKHHPGDYETVRRILGHRNIQTTINFYCGLETIQASEEFGKLIGRARGRAGDPDQPDLNDAR